MQADEERVEDLVRPCTFRTVGLRTFPFACGYTGFELGSLGELALEKFFVDAAGCRRNLEDEDLVRLWSHSSCEKTL